MHFVKSMSPSYPVTPGHEIVGVATHVGRNVLDVSVGDNVAVGCMVDSCFGCRSCRASEEQYCVNGMVLTYGGETKYGRAGPDGRPTHGGFSRRFVANKRFVFKLPRDADLARCAPLLCAGITTYDPLVRLGCAPDAWQFSSPTGRKRVGVVGLGGLGQMAVKLARSFHCEVVALSTSPGKEKTARDIGADHFWLTTDRNLMREKAELAAKAPEREAPVHKKQSPGPPPAETPPAGLVSDPAPAGERVGLDVILDTVSAPHDLDALVDLLAPDGQLVLLGLNEEAFEVSGLKLVFSRKIIRGSLIGGARRTRECVDYCVGKGIYPEVEIIDAGKTGEAMRKLDEKNDRVVRYVVDCGTIPSAGDAAA